MGDNFMDYIINNYMGTMDTNGVNIMDKHVNDINNYNAGNNVNYNDNYNDTEHNNVYNNTQHNNVNNSDDNIINNHDNLNHDNNNYYNVNHDINNDNNNSVNDKINNLSSDIYSQYTVFSDTVFFV